ncbi:MAG: hypothetical protein RBT36_00785 [Desulfobulbus sp.]|jgi:hypothetical protein|nr:hypothetical protein [Desulfobulbus sp.]
MIQQMFGVKTVQALVPFFLGFVLLFAGTAWCDTGTNPIPSAESSAAVAAVKEAKVDMALNPEARADKVWQALYTLSNQDLMDLMQETGMEMPIYEQLTQMHPAAEEVSGPVVGDEPPVPVGNAQVQQALETALTQPDKRQFIVFLLSNYMLNNSDY